MIVLAVLLAAPAALAQESWVDDDQFEDFQEPGQMPEMAEEDEVVCCMAMIASCLACSARQTIE